MIETIFPPSLNWHLSKIISTRDDGSIAYGSQNNIFILKVDDGAVYPLIIVDAHKDKITSVTFCAHSKNGEGRDLVLSASEDGFVKIWNINAQTPIIGHNSHTIHKDVSKVVCADWCPRNSQYAVSAAENDTLVLWNTLVNTTTKYAFPKLRPTVMECSYHSEKIVAVGSKTGMVYVVKLEGKGEILHRLRGHDKEIQAIVWCPVSDVNSENPDEKHLFASSTAEKEIFIWQDDGECVVNMELPRSPLSKDHQYTKWDSGVNFTPILWPSPDRLYASTRFGELIFCNPLLVVASERKYPSMNKRITFSGWQLLHDMHSSIISAIAGVPTQIQNGNTKADKTEKTSSSIEFEIEDSFDVRKDYLVWTVGKDQKIIAYREYSGFQPTFFYNSINGSAFIAAHSPHDPHLIAMGVGDGKIRIWNTTNSSGNARVFGHKINDRVYSVAWHPKQEGILAYGTSGGRIGIVDVFSQKPPSNFISRHSGKVYCLAWGPTYPRPCVPEREQPYTLFSVGGHKILSHDIKTLRSETKDIPSDLPCKKFVDLSWRTDYKLIALGSKKGYIYILKAPSFQVVCKLFATTKCIMSTTWHPHATVIDGRCYEFMNYITFASIDKENVIKVYNCIEEDDSYKMEIVSTLKGHTGYIQFVSWSSHMCGRLLSSSADYTVRIWDVTKSVQLVKLQASTSILPLFSIWSQMDPDVIITGYTERILISTRISSVKSDTILKVFKMEKGNKLQLGEVTAELENISRGCRLETEANAQPIQNDATKLNLAKRIEDQKSARESKMFMKAWNTDTCAVQSCYELLKACDDDHEPSYKFSFLKHEIDFKAGLTAEDDIYRITGNWATRYQLGIWRGNLNVILEEHMASGNLDDSLLSLAPFVSPLTWRKACITYANTLVEKRCYRKAATYLLAVNNIYEAIEVLQNADLYLEAICVARCRLPRTDPIFLQLVRQYATWLTETGNVLKASECLIYLQDFSEVVRILAKKNHPDHLSLAALASRLADLYDLECEYSYRALVLCFESDKMDLAGRICADHPNIKKLFLLYQAYQTILNLDSKQLTLEKDLISYIKELTRTENDPVTYASLQYVADGTEVSPSKKSVFIALAHELSFACCVRDEVGRLTHIIKAVHIASKYVNKQTDDIPMLYKLSSWLCPEWTVDYLTRTDADCGVIGPKLTSLRAFLCLAIVEFMRRVLDQKTTAGDLSYQISMMDKFVNDALDKNTFKYYANQLEIKSVEKKLANIYKKENEYRSDSPTPYVHSSDSESDNNIPSTGFILSEEEKLLTSLKERMMELKLEMKRFEESRIAAPNPAFVFCSLRDVLDNTKGKEILKKVEKRWEEIQRE